jgi:hypothetical protein
MKAQECESRRSPSLGSQKECENGNYNCEGQTVKGMMVAGEPENRMPAVSGEQLRNDAETVDIRHYAS